MKIYISIIFICFISSFACVLSKQESSPIEITAKQFIEDYSKDSQASDEKYAEKMLAVTGIISHYAEINGTVGVYLKGNLNNEWTIICLIDKASQPEVYDKLKRGDIGTFIGIGQHRKDEKLIYMKDCKIK